MLTIISRIIHYGVKNFWRNGWLSAATVVILVLALLVSIGLMLFGVTTARALESIQDKIDISVHFKPETSEDHILTIKQSLESLTEVKAVSYISQDQALQIFRDSHKDDPTITQALDELEANPLEASLNVKAKHPDQYASIAEYLESPNLKQSIDSVSFAKNQVVIERLTAIVNNVSRGGLIASIMMALIAGLVVFNTVRLAIYSNRDEISIMRVVGASNSLVRGPYVVEGIIAGILGAVASIILATPLIYLISPWLGKLVPSLSIAAYFTSNLLLILAYQLVFGIFIGAVSSFIAVRRYLKN